MNIEKIKEELKYRNNSPYLISTRFDGIIESLNDFFDFSLVNYIFYFCGENKFLEMEIICSNQLSRDSFELKKN